MKITENMFLTTGVRVSRVQTKRSVLKILRGVAILIFWSLTHPGFEFWGCDPLTVVGREVESRFIGDWSSLLPREYIQRVSGITNHFDTKCLRSFILFWDQGHVNVNISKKHDDHDINHDDKNNDNTDLPPLIIIMIINVHNHDGGYPSLSPPSRVPNHPQPRFSIALWSEVSSPRGHFDCDDFNVD